MKRVAFVVATHYNVVGATGGHTVKRSARLDLEDALAVLLAELPEGALTRTRDAEDDMDMLVIDWGKVPDAIRYGSQKRAAQATGTEN